MGINFLQFGGGKKKIIIDHKLERLKYPRPYVRSDKSFVFLFFFVYIGSLLFFKTESFGVIDG